jgi:hypothetical protein
MRISELLNESDPTTTTTSNAIGTVTSPHIAIGPDRKKSSYSGSPGKSGTKAPKVPKPKKQKPTDNALDMKGTSIFGGALKR